MDTKTSLIKTDTLASGLPSHLQRMVMENGGMRIHPVCKSGDLESRNTCGVLRYPEDRQPLTDALVNRGQVCPTTRVEFLARLLAEGVLLA